MFHLPDPELQVEFAGRLDEIRKKYLQDALKTAVKRISIPLIDTELAKLVPASSLSLLASTGIRGEMVFPVPVVIRHSPSLLAYYRLLYGYSQKEFYAAATGAARFKSLEDSDKLPERLKDEIEGLCAALCQAGHLLIAGISASEIDLRLLDSLTLLTLGPQLRGGANVRRGTAGIRAVFNIIHEIVGSAAISVEPTKIKLANAAGRTVWIEFASDPDIVIREQMRVDASRLLIAIEIKAGSDFSNIHNRIGEAEKSHQKARAQGFTECWTVLNVDRTDMKMAQRESPSTNRFYRISALLSKEGTEYQDFVDRVISLTGIRASE